MNKIFNKLKKYNNDKFNPNSFKYNDFLSLKFSLSRKLKLNFFKNNDFDVIKLKNKKLFINKEYILENIKKNKILPLYILDNENDHLISLIIDNKKKTIFLFTNTNIENNKQIYKKIIELFNLNYKIIIDNSKCYSYELCVPLSLLMIYSYFNKVDFNDFINYINNLSGELLYNLINSFVNYLEN